MNGYLYVAATVFCTVYGQLVLKWRIGMYGALPEGFSCKIMFLLRLICDPFIFSGFGAAFIAALFWMAAMTKFDISQVYPIIVGGLAMLTSVFAIVFLREPLTLMKLFGLVLIVAGVYCIGRP
ncbi:small multidrug resistance protein [Denitrovibrio acetiphilus DSM 12809]|uniref:Small multidrug resistance protein n=1 Tax=Denitrovibrio acetiphilus (strain DSM 12809 / NBRC 114555 / N2460) TaxID=522772 RepID=D4H5U1_DENA2|nr:EamA family transporter [Denitrovibrio acetiphilus]ADD69532.1 small multidrug resistance protein [Denitrovibrio acetiphilus DSM 12809]